MGGGPASNKFMKVAGKLLGRTCGSFCRDPCAGGAISVTAGCDFPPNFSSSRGTLQGGIISCLKNPSENLGSASSSVSPINKNMCAICLDHLNYSSGGSPGEAIFTAQCSHSFHFNCISSNVRHGSITCPICRAQWTQLPRNLNIRGLVQFSKPDPVLQILDDSIANSRFHRRSFLRSARYDDDDPVDPDTTTEQPHFQFLVEETGHLVVRLGYQPSTDLVLVACPEEPHLRMMKQAMALVVFSLRPGDRLAIVTYSSAAARVFPLRRMTPFGKKAALQVIDRLFYIGQVDPNEGLNKGAKILSDRIHKNPRSCILHLTNTPTRSYQIPDTENRISVHRFHLGFGLTIHQFEEFLSRILSGTIHDIQLRIKDRPSVIRIRELRGGEEQRVRINTQECWPLHIEYSYMDSGREGEQRARYGEAIVGFGEKGDRSEDLVAATGTRVDDLSKKWEYHDPFMARRWAKYLHGHRL